MDPRAAAHSLPGGGGQKKVRQSSAWDDTTSPTSVLAPDRAGGPGPSLRHLGIVMQHDFYFPSNQVTHRGLCCPSSQLWALKGWGYGHHQGTPSLKAQRETCGDTNPGCLWDTLGTVGSGASRDPGLAGEAGRPLHAPQGPGSSRGTQKSSREGASWEPPAAAAAREGDAASGKARLPLPAWPEEAAPEKPGPGHSCGCKGGQCAQGTDLLPPAGPT